MRVEMRLKGYLAAVAPVARFETDLPEGSRVGDLLEAYLSHHGKEVRKDFLDPGQKLPAENVLVYVQDGERVKQVPLDAILREGAIVTVTSPLAGG